MSDDWLVDVLGQIAAYADNRSLDWLHPLMDEAHVTARRELILNGSVSLKGLEALPQRQVHPKTDGREVVSAQIIDFEHFRLQRASLALSATGQSAFFVN